MSQEAHPLVTEAVGWHGKLPVAGDFVTRRLHAGFVEAWDGWLSGGLAALRQRDAQHWLEHYLASPAWRFVITQQFLPGPLGLAAWGGVMIPSVDRVGRYYPLTLAARLHSLPCVHQQQAGLWSWLHQLEDVAVDAMQDDWSIEQLDAVLLRLGLPQPAEPVPGHPEEGGPWTPFFSACLDAVQAGAGRCVWYSGAGLQATRLMVSQGLDESVLGLWA